MSKATPGSCIDLAASLLLGAGLLMMSGCHSAFVQATVVNRSGRALQMFELDYPNASFGSGALGDGAQYHYRFKILDTGNAELLWTDASGHEHTAQGPAMHEGQEGKVSVTIGPETATWQTDLHPVR